MYKYCNVCNCKFKKSYISLKDEKFIPNVDSAECLKLFLTQERKAKFKAKDKNRKLFKEQKEARSFYEADFINWLIRKGIKFEYEKYIFQVASNIFYVPDFYLPEYKIFIEVKGLFYPGAFRKFKIFASTSGYTIYLIHEKLIRLIRKDLENERLYI